MKIQHNSDQHLDIQHHLIKVQEHLKIVKDLVGSEGKFDPELEVLLERVKHLSLDIDNAVK